MVGRVPLRWKKLFATANFTVNWTAFLAQLTGRPLSSLLTVWISDARVNARTTRARLLLGEQYMWFISRLVSESRARSICARSFVIVALRRACRKRKRDRERERMLAKNTLSEFFEFSVLHLSRQLDTIYSRSIRMYAPPKVVLSVHKGTSRDVKRVLSNSLCDLPVVDLPVHCAEA